MSRPPASEPRCLRCDIATDRPVTQSVTLSPWLWGLRMVADGQSARSNRLARAWLGANGVQEVAGSNPVAPTILVAKGWTLPKAILRV